PDIPVWQLVGAWQDNTLQFPTKCSGSLAPRPDSLRNQPRTLTVRFARDRRTEIRPDFGGYRIYRMTNAPDSSNAVLIRRFSLNTGSELTWHASRVTKTSTISALINDGAGSLFPLQRLPTGVTPVAIAIGDVDKDTSVIRSGTADLAV